MKLITEVTIPDYPFRMDQQSPIVLMGSCFTENIGSMLERYLFPVCVNPFGVSYNPLSVKTGLEALLGKEKYLEEDLDQYNNLWFSFDHYTGFSSPVRQEALDKINLSFGRAKEMMQDVQFLILTWGSAWVYTYKATGKVVCNCHKIPASQFTRSRLSVSDITGAYHSFLPALFESNKKLRILFTVSPVRHWKDGAHGNQLSKGTLLLAQEELVKQYPEQICYFPSYELVMDELRDYRFYSGDMLHTNHLATQYIWEKFEHGLIGDETRHIIGELIPLLKMMEHRPLSDKGTSHQEMVQKKDEKLNTLKNKYPFLAWENLKKK